LLIGRSFKKVGGGGNEFKVDLVQKGLYDYWKVKQKLRIYNPQKVIAQVVIKIDVKPLSTCGIFDSTCVESIAFAVVRGATFRCSFSAFLTYKNFTKSKEQSLFAAPNPFLILTTHHHISNIFLLTVPFHNTITFQLFFYYLAISISILS